MTDMNEEDLTIVYMLGRHEGRKDAERIKSLATANGSLVELIERGDDLATAIEAYFIESDRMPTMQMLSAIKEWQIAKAENVEARQNEAQPRD